jgi:hypothetical protein
MRSDQRSDISICGTVSLHSWSIISDLLAWAAGCGVRRALSSLTVAELRRTLEADADLAGVVAILCDEGPIVRDRPVGSRNSGTFRYCLWANAFPKVSLDAWDEAAATRVLVRLYVDGYGPVSRADLIWWTGLPARRIDDAPHGLGGELVTVSITGVGERLLMTAEPSTRRWRPNREPSRPTCSRCSIRTRCAAKTAAGSWTPA